MIVSDDGGSVEQERAEVVDAAAHTEAIGPLAVAQATGSLVVTNFCSDDDHGAGPDIDAAAEAVAAVAANVAVAAEGPVVADGAIENRHRPTGDIEAATQAVAAVGPAFAIMAEGQVVFQAAAEDGKDTSTPDAAARTEAGGVAADTGGTTDGLIVRDRSTQDRESCQRADVGWVGRGAVVKDPAAQATAAVAAVLPVAADGLVAGEQTVRDSEDRTKEGRYAAA